uniref:LRRCT domain-containing protein n=1 Tax=Branchiostoma floridae TaxID=7739 RepID=C3YZ47_BRAFL|eukprot:XP_002598543.1 hypothetical protein BRAFLDRAFT_66934 [Branchiostoma floridae]
MTELKNCGRAHQGNTKVKSKESDTFLINDSGNNNTQTQPWKDFNTTEIYKNNSSTKIVLPIENDLNNGAVVRGSNHGHPVADQISPTLPILNAKDQCSGISTQGLDDNEQLVVRSEDQILTAMINSAHHSASAGGLNDDTNVVSNDTELCVDSSLTKTETSNQTSCADQVVDSANYMHSTSAEGLSQEHRGSNEVSTHLKNCGQTHQAKTKLQSVEQGTFLINGSGSNSTQTEPWKKVNTAERYKKSPRMSSSTTVNSDSKSATESMNATTKAGQQLPVTVIYKVIILDGSILILMFISRLVRYLIKRDPCRNRQEVAGNGCFCLPNGCEVEEFTTLCEVTIRCNMLNLMTVPEDIPPNAARLKVSYNEIRNVTYLPSLPQLSSLDLSYNSIESVSWMSLQTLPALYRLQLQENKLTYVNLGIVIEHLPKLKIVNLGMNKLATFSQYALGWPHIKTVVINHNPFHCDCELSWLIDKMTCLHACKGRDRKACCSSCSACFVHLIPTGRFDCKSPSQLHRRLLSEVSTQLTDCGSTQQARTGVQSIKSALTSPTVRVGKHQHTDPTMEKSISNRILREHSWASTTLTNAYSSAKSADTRKDKGKKYTILYKTIFLIEICLIITFIVCLVRLMMRKNLGCNRQEDADANVDHRSIHLHRIAPPAETNPCHVVGGSNHGPPVASQSTPTVPIHNSVHQCGGKSSAEGLNQEHHDDNETVSGEHLMPQPENSANHSTGVLYDETVTFSNNTEHYVCTNLTQTDPSNQYACAEPTLDSTNYMYNASVEGLNNE